MHIEGMNYEVLTFIEHIVSMTHYNLHRLFQNGRISQRILTLHANA